MQIKALTFIFLISFCCAQVQVQSLGKSGLENALLIERKGDLREAQKIYELILETKPKKKQLSPWTFKGTDICIFLLME